VREEVTYDWWRAKPGKDATVHDKLTSYVDDEEQAASYLHWLDRIHWAMYENELMTEGGNYARALASLRRHGFTSSKLRVAQSIVDTVVSKLGKRHPAIKVNPSNADWSLKRKGRQLTKWIRGKNQELELQEVSPLIFLDACVTGTGVLKIGNEFDEIVLDRVPRRELFVNAREARYGKPRQLHHKRTMCRDVLVEMFPDFRYQIEKAGNLEAWIDEEDDFVGVETGNLIKVYESWHLPSGPNADDGRHAICIDGATLLYEKWERARFPFAFMRYAPREKGFWGMGLIEAVAENQYNINQTVRDIQQALYYGAQLKVLAQRGSKIIKSHLGRNQGPFVIEYDGRPPEWIAPNPVSKDQLEYLRQEIEWAYEFTGVSQMSASSKNPLGANASGAALQEFYDLESERLADPEQRWARWHVDVAECEIDTAKEIAADHKGYGARWNQRSFFEQIPWAEVDMKRDQYHLALEATNFLPDTRAGKLDQAERLAQNGFIDPSAAFAVLADFPDLERVNRLKLAPREHLEFVMEQLEDESVPFEDVQPESFMDLELGIPMAKAYYARAVTEGAPDEVQQRFRDWIVAAENIANIAPPPQPEMPVGPDGMPMEAGAPPPMPDAAALEGPAPMPGPPMPGSQPGGGMPL
jgi:hypothetical protein